MGAKTVRAHMMTNRSVYKEMRPFQTKTHLSAYNGVGSCTERCIYSNFYAESFGFVINLGQIRDIWHLFGASDVHLKHLDEFRVRMVYHSDSESGPEFGYGAR